jgi:hypothetical protein
MNPFAYPAVPHVRRHGPLGYASYESYRERLRDEFCFRCVYCLNREQWVIAKGAFAIDHFVPTSVDPTRISDYDNLLYTCVACNLSRGSQLIPNPLEHLLSSRVTAQANGLLIARTPEANEIIEAVHLNDREYVIRRGQMIALLTELERSRPDLHRVWLGFPEDLPDLERLRPPGGNKRPAGIEQSYRMRRDRNELPTCY